MTYLCVWIFPAVVPVLSGDFFCLSVEYFGLMLQSAFPIYI